MYTLTAILASKAVCEELQCVLAVRKTCDDDDLTQRDKMSSESLTDAKFDDLQCHCFPVSGSPMCCTSEGDGDTVLGGHCKEVKAIPIHPL